jgi:ribonuclease-3
VVTVDGDQHNQLFTVRCQLSDALIYSLGTGSSRRRAEQSAAELMLEQIKI